MTLLSIVSDACRELSLEVPSAVIASTDPQVRLFLRCAQEGGKSLATRAPWSILRSEKTFTTVATASQGTSSLADDLDWIIPETLFNRTRRRRLFGPITPEEWQHIQASLVTRVDPAFMIRGGAMYITPTPDAGDTIAYEYQSVNWCQSSGGTAQSAWAADNDTAKLDESLLALDLVWRFRAAKGLDYLTAMTAFERRLADKLMRDGVRPRIDTTCPDSGSRIPIPPQVPDTLVFT